MDMLGLGAILGALDENDGGLVEENNKLLKKIVAGMAFPTILSTKLNIGRQNGILDMPTSVFNMKLENGRWSIRDKVYTEPDYANATLTTLPDTNLRPYDVFQDDSYLYSVSYGNSTTTYVQKITKATLEVQTLTMTTSGTVDIFTCVIHNGKLYIPCGINLYRVDLASLTNEGIVWTLTDATTPSIKKVRVHAGTNVLYALCNSGENSYHIRALDLNNSFSQLYFKKQSASYTNFEVVHDYIFWYYFYSGSHFFYIHDLQLNNIPTNTNGFRSSACQIYISNAGNGGHNASKVINDNYWYCTFSGSHVVIPLTNIVNYIQQKDNSAPPYVRTLINNSSYFWTLLGRETVGYSHSTQLQPTIHHLGGGRSFYPDIQGSLVDDTTGGVYTNWSMQGAGWIDEKNGKVYFVIQDSADSKRKILTVPLKTQKYIGCLEVAVDFQYDQPKYSSMTAWKEVWASIDLGTSTSENPISIYLQTSSSVSGLKTNDYNHPSYLPTPIQNKDLINGKIKFLGNTVDIIATQNQHEFDMSKATVGYLQANNVTGVKINGQDLLSSEFGYDSMNEKLNIVSGVVINAGDIVTPEYDIAQAMSANVATYRAINLQIFFEKATENEISPSISDNVIISFIL